MQHKQLDPELERQLLSFSVLASLFFTVLGIAVGLLTQSAVVLFDGLYSGISLLLSYLSLMALRSVNSDDNPSFPYGKSAIEPFLVGLKYLTLIVLCLVSAFGAGMDLFHGGSDVNIGIALIYSLFSTMVGIAIYVYFKRAANNLQSDLVKSEEHEWFLDTVLTAGIFIGFLIALGLLWLGFEQWVPYIDPLMVLIASTAFIAMPMRGLIQSAKELVGFQPKGKMVKKLQQMAEEIRVENHFEAKVVRVQKVGRTVFLEIDFVVREDDYTVTLVRQDEIREQIFEKIRPLGYRWWLTVAFTKDEKWAA
ncbi:cation diffusion facilitator family transporter [Pseudidiomarina indica]|uniref:Cation diffusion facilitator family transporter n=1 Tax=Pseudidiomarina indica TaxID=1159017 RepID=A0A1G6DBY2_9GAMM|nr:cation transporter [Pseudidiomarina indica]SDB42621.1 cation diffusion facilitator family transporter [Pseudidiomarina indica]